MRVVAVALLIIAVAGALWRPKGIPAWVVPAVLAVVAGAIGVVDRGEVHDALRPLLGPLAFVLVAVPLAATLDEVGIFRELAALAARTRAVVGVLWVIAALVVAFLNLDAAVVLLTPIYIHTAELVDIDPVALAFQPVLLASLASGVLVVSNLTNLIAASQLSLDNGDFLRHLALPSAAATAVGWCAYRLQFRDRPSRPAVVPVVDRRALVVGVSAIAVFVVLLVGGERFGLPAWMAAAITEIGLVAYVRRSPLSHVPWGTVLLASSLTVLAAGAAAALAGHVDVLGEGGVRGFTSSTAAAALANNLPACLVALAHVHDVSHVWPMLLGVNLGPTLLMTGSLAGLLWHASARRAGVDISPLRYSRVGIAVGVPAMVAGMLVFAWLG